MKPLSDEQREKAKERSRLYYLAHKEHCRMLSYERALKKGRIKAPRKETLERYGLSESA